MRSISVPPPLAVCQLSRRARARLQPIVLLMDVPRALDVHTCV